MSDQLPEGALIECSVTIRLPHAATADQVQEWLQFGMMQTGGISADNPLFHESPEQFGPRGLAWEYHYQIGRREEYDSVQVNENERRYKVRYIREPAPAA